MNQGQRPSFSPPAEHADGTADEVREFAPKPTRGQVASLRIATSVIGGGCVAGLAYWRLSGDTVGLAPMSWVAIVWLVSNMRFSPVPREVRKTAGYWLRYAWCGERVKPPRLMRAATAADQRARVDDSAAQEALPTWIRAGFPPGSASRADYDLSDHVAVGSVELTGEELGVIAHVTGLEGTLMPVGLMGAMRDDERRQIIDELVHGGILRRTAADVPSARWANFVGPGNAELAPPMLPLIGVARFAETGLKVEWSQDGPREVRAFAVPGHVVLIELVAGRGERGTRYRVSSTTAAELGRRVAGVCDDLQTVGHGGVTVAQLAGVYERWTIEARPGGNYRLLGRGEPAAHARHLSRTELGFDLGVLLGA